MGNDYLTGLLGAGEFIEKASEIVKQGGRRFAIITNDISNFKYINDFYGMTEGDNLISEMAHFFYIDNPYCLAACRTTCDQFRGLFDISDRTEDEELDRIVEMNTQFEQLMTAKYPNVFIHVYTGIYFLDSNTEDIRIAADRAHIAKKQIKGKFNVKYEIYNPDKFKNMLQHMEIANMFIHATETDNVLMFLQPKFSVSENHIVGAEALVRLRSKDGSIIPPGVFIPVLESTGMIGKLVEIMIEKVFALQRKWMDQNIPLFPISVNVSRMEFSKTDFASTVLNLQKIYNIPPEYIEFELTETIFIEAIDYIVDAINILRQNGFKVSVDDFGSGYSSLNQIASIPADIIKIDRVFASEGLNTSKGRTVVQSLIQMLHNIDYKIVFEGIETTEQRDYVSSFGCDIIQGFLYSRPLPIDDFESKYIDPIK